MKARTGWYQSRGRTGWFWSRSRTEGCPTGGRTGGSPSGGRTGGRPILRLIVAALLGSLWACAGDGGEGSGSAAAAEGGWRGAVLDPPVEKVGFTLQDTEGRAFDFLDRTEGSLTLLFFGYTYCPDICPVHLANIAAVLGDWPHELREKVSVVFVSTDPERDTPERIREWLDAFDPAFIGLRGDQDRVNEIERSFGLPPSFVDPGQDPESYLVGHAAQVLAFTPDGLAHIAFPFGTRQADLAVDLPRLAREGFARSGAP